jgi:hypothetical protein
MIMVCHCHGQFHGLQFFVQILLLLLLFLLATIVPSVSARRGVDVFSFVEVEELPAEFKAIGYEGHNNDNYGEEDGDDKECRSIGKKKARKRAKQ